MTKNNFGIDGDKLSQDDIDNLAELGVALPIRSWIWKWSS